MIVRKPDMSASCTMCSKELEDAAALQYKIHSEMIIQVDLLKKLLETMPRKLLDVAFNEDRTPEIIRSSFYIFGDDDILQDVGIIINDYRKAGVEYLEALIRYDTCEHK